MEIGLVMERSANNTPSRVSTKQTFPTDLHPITKIKCSRLKMLHIDKEAKSLRRNIRFIFLLRSFNNFLGYCVVTWATVVVLGGILASISKAEFMRVSFLLLLQALYLAYNSFWPSILVRLSDVASYFAGHSPPSSTLPGSAIWLTYSRRAGALVLLVLTCSTSLTCMVFSTYTSQRQLSKHHVTGASDISDSALKIFYVLLLVNAGVAYIQMWFATPALRVSKKGVSICALSYFFRAINLSQEKNYFRSRELELLDFVYDIMSDECGESMERGALYSLCLDMVPYVYHHPRGFEATLAAMESSNYYVQESAALMVGFLVHLERHLPDAPRLLRLQEAVVRRLIDLGLGTGMVEGPRKDASSWSLLMLAQHDPQALVRVSSFLQDLVEAINTMLMVRGLECDSKSWEGHYGLYLLINIANAMLQHEDSRKHFTTQQMSLLSELGTELLKQISGIQTSSNNELPLLSSHLEKAATVTLTLLQNVPLPQDAEVDLQDDELADPQSVGIKTKRWIVLLLCISNVGLTALLNYACSAVYDAIV